MTLLSRLVRDGNAFLHDVNGPCHNGLNMIGCPYRASTTGDEHRCLAKD
jgi:hypothetical protein